MKYKITIGKKVSSVMLSSTQLARGSNQLLIDGEVFGAEWRSHLGVIVIQKLSQMDSTKQTNQVLERMVRIRSHRCRRSDDTGFDTQIFTEMVTKNSNSIYGQFAPDLPQLSSLQKGQSTRDQIVKSQITGKILALSVSVGQEVSPGDTLVIIEAMKMENRVFAAKSGVVDTVAVKVGDAITVGQTLMVLKKGEK